jgi:hypothetical protein
MRVSLLSVCLLFLGFSGTTIANEKCEYWTNIKKDYGNRVTTMKKETDANQNVCEAKDDAKLDVEKCGEHMDKLLTLEGLERSVENVEVFFESHCPDKKNFDNICNFWREKEKQQVDLHKDITDKIKTCEGKKDKKEGECDVEELSTLAESKDSHIGEVGEFMKKHCPTPKLDAKVSQLEKKQ